VVFVALVWPLFMWFAYLAAGRRFSYWWAFTHLQPFLDSGPLWFAEVLLYVSLGYAAWHWTVARVGRPALRQRASLRGRHLVAVALGVAVASFVVRLWFPARSTQILGLHLWQWPQCVAMFGLGIAAGHGGWQVRAPRELCRTCGWAVAVAIAVVPVLAFATGVPTLPRTARRSSADGTGRR
jgi:hypothetical protein